MFLIIFISLLIAKSNAYLLSFENLNPDEAQMISNAIGLFNKNFNIFEFDGTTSGLLNSFILLWPLILNLEITFLTAKLTSIFLISSITYILFKIIFAQTKNLKTTFLLFSPFFIFFIFTKDPDFSHYSSELFSTLILISVYWIVKKNEKISYSKIYLSSFLLGLTFFSKIQFFPVAFIMLCLINYDFLIKKNYKIIISSFLYFFSSFALVLIIFIISGNLKDFLYNNFLFVLNFIQSSQSEKILFEAVTKNQVKLSSTIASGFKDHLFQNLIFHSLYLYFIIFILLISKIISTKKKSILFSRDIIKISIIIISYIFVILIPGKLHRHYLLALFPFIPLVLSQIIFSYEKMKIKIFSKYISYSLMVLIIPLLFSGFAEDKKFYSQKFKFEKFNIENINFKSPRIFDYMFEENKNKKLYIWGWIPEWYVLSYLPSAARETISEKQIEISKNREYYRKRLMKDLEKNNPNLIIDSVKKKSFRYNKPSQSINSFNELKVFINKKYTKLKKINDNCPDYYLLKDNEKILKEKLLPYKVININNNNVRKINDYSVTEDICDDSYIFDEASTDFLDLKLTNNSKVSKVLILASKKNSENIEVEFFIFNKNSVIKKGKLNLNKFPFWSYVDLSEETNFDKIRIDTKSLKKHNYGINEIKIFKP